MSTPNPTLTLASLLLLALAPVAAAQTAEGYELMPGRLTGTNDGITFVVRYAGNPPPVFEALQMYDQRYLHGLGDLRGTGRGKTSGPCEIGTFKIRYQDEDGSTVEGFKIVARPETAPGSRAADMTKSLFSQAVPGSPATPAGPAGFLMTVQVMGGSAVAVPCQDTFFFGMEVPVVPSGKSWPSQDGLSITASAADTLPGYSIFDWPKGGHASDYLYFLGGTPSTHFPERMVFGYALLPDAPVLQAAARHKLGTSRHGSDNGYGAAAIWPEVDPTTARGMVSADGLGIRVTDNRFAAGATFGLFLALRNAKQQNLPVVS
ncbi:MAG: hypothetical protein KDC87_06640, partial [Planctomycetes bacterium]|nr:hypothetical protein [Planctomycetota bacterium]